MEQNIEDNQETDLLTAKSSLPAVEDNDRVLAANAGINAEPTSDQQLCDFCAMKCCSCVCPQLEAEAVQDNQQLLAFQVRSRDINWAEYVRPLDTQVRGQAVYLDRQSGFVSAHRRKQHENNRRELLLCHDMMGNYLADRHFNSSEKFDDYRFVHWSAVDYFCYFSHNYVTIPPSGWLNAAHRHGVPVLGTYIVENGLGSRLLHELLASEASVKAAVAALTRLCLHFRFEGWLVNVECTVKAESMPNLYYFVEQLRLATETQVAHGRVFWYDSVTETGELHWQNELNQRNVKFFRHSHGTLINYTWGDRHLVVSEATMQQERAAAHRLFMGLDVFGRGQLGRFQSTQTLSRIANRGFSAGIFAPAWCFETLQKYGYNIRNSSGDASVNTAFLLRNERWWSSLWQWLGTHPYRTLPFYTDFCVGSGRDSFACGTREHATRPFFNLARQALQPSVPLSDNAEHSFDAVFAGGCALRVVNYERAFRLFLTEFELQLGVLLLTYAYRMDADDADHTLDVVLRFAAPRHSLQDIYVFCGAYNNENFLTPGLCYISPLDGAVPRDLAHEQLPPEQGALGENWRVRYYLMRFDGPVELQDMGIKCRRPQLSTANAYFGALYVQQLQPGQWHAAEVANKADIPAYKNQLWNEYMERTTAEASA